MKQYTYKHSKLGAILTIASSTPKLAREKLGYMVYKVSEWKRLK